jgi:hypothetical protein
MRQKILAIALSSEQYALLQQKAIAQQKEAGQLGLEIIRNWLRQQTKIEENTTLESTDEQALEAAYRKYYADAEDDLRIVRNMRTVQMRAFEKSH